VSPKWWKVSWLHTNRSDRDGQFVPASSGSESPDSHAPPWNPGTLETPESCKKHISSLASILDRTGTGPTKYGVEGQTVAGPLPGVVAGRPKFNQLEMVTTFTYIRSLVKIDACLIAVTDPQTNKQTHKCTYRQDRLQYTAPLSLAPSVIILTQSKWP